MLCDICKKSIRFYQGKFSYIQLDQNGAKKLECHLECIRQKGFDMLDGTHMDFVSNADRNISDLDDTLREELK